MAGKKPKTGWVYFINPYRVSLKCGLGHTYLYELTEPGEVECRHPSCKCRLNSSRVFRGEHPHIIWTNNEFLDEFDYVQTFTVIPLTTSTRDTGLPTTYPITPTQRNGFDEKSYVLIHQLTTVDGNCFKDSSGNWLKSTGQVEKKDREAIEERLMYFLGMKDDSEDWLMKNSSIEILQKVFDFLPDKEIKTRAIDVLLNRLEE